MNKDLFQISQMNDIFYTLNLWAILSPRLARDEPTVTSETIPKKRALKRRRKKLIKE